MLDFRNMAPVALILFLLVQTVCTPAVETTAMTIGRVRYDPAVARFPANTEGAVCAEMTRDIDNFLQSVGAANRVTAGNRLQQ